MSKLKEIKENLAFATETEGEEYAHKSLNKEQINWLIQEVEKYSIKEDRTEERSDHPIIKVAKREVSITRSRSVPNEVPTVNLPVEHAVWLIHQSEKALLFEESKCNTVDPQLSLASTNGIAKLDQ
ncbi:hypothetical protein [Pseudobacillus badius]|uniref:hypothetical protein n=1 Tax=Bacillus badius TaxID=1455 RepID=UPI003D3465D9